MAAQRKAIWDDATWNQPPGALTEAAPSHALLITLKAQAAILQEVAGVDVDAILEGLAAYRSLQHLIRPPEDLLAAQMEEARGSNPSFT